METKNRLTITGILILMSPIALIYYFSSAPQYRYHNDEQAALIVSFKKHAEKVKVCDEEDLKKFREEVKALPKHMRSAGGACGSRERLPMQMKIWIDDKEAVDKILTAGGLRNDGITFTYERFLLLRGVHKVKVSVRDYVEGKEGFDYSIERSIEFGDRQIVVVSYEKQTDRLYILNERNKS